MKNDAQTGLSLMHVHCVGCERDDEDGALSLCVASMQQILHYLYTAKLADGLLDKEPTDSRIELVCELLRLSDAMLLTHLKQACEARLPTPQSSARSPFIPRFALCPPEFAT